MSKKDTFIEFEKLLSHGDPHAVISVEEILRLLANFMTGDQFKEFYQFVKEEYTP